MRAMIGMIICLEISCFLFIHFIFCEETHCSYSYQLKSYGKPSPRWPSPCWVPVHWHAIVTRRQSHPRKPRHANTTTYFSAILRNTFDYFPFQTHPICRSNYSTIQKMRCPHFGEFAPPPAQMHTSTRPEHIKLRRRQRSFESA